MLWRGLDGATGPYPVAARGDPHADGERGGLGMCLPAWEVTGPCGRRRCSGAFGGRRALRGVQCARREERVLAGLRAGRARIPLCPLWRCPSDFLSTRAFLLPL